MFRIDIDFNVFKGNDEEQWKPIEGFPGYEVSDKGRVRSFKSGKAKILKPGLRSGYFFVILSNNGVKQTKDIHRLVAEAFLGIPKEKLEVNHKNGKKTDNRLENLEWVSHAENMRHADELGLRNIKGENHPRSKLTNEEVLKIFEIANAGVPTSEIAQIFNVAPCTISNIKAGRRWAHLTGAPQTNPLSKNPGDLSPITINLNINIGQEAI